MATGTSGTERTIGQLVADATHDLEGIVRGEIALAKAEVTDGAKVLGKGAGLLAGAAFLALMGVVFLLHSAAWGIAEWLPGLGRLPHRRRRRADRRRRPRPARQEGPRDRPAGAGARHRPGPADHRRHQGTVRRRGCRRRRRRVPRHPAPRHDGVRHRAPAARAPRHPGTTGGAPGSGRRRQPDRHSPVDTVRDAFTPRRRTGADLVEGERVAGVRVVERGREDHADDVAARVDHRAAGRAAAHLRPQRVDLAADLRVAVDVGAPGPQHVAHPGGPDPQPVVAGEPGERGLGPGVELLPLVGGGRRRGRAPRAPRRRGRGSKATTRASRSRPVPRTLTVTRSAPATTWALVATRARGDDPAAADLGLPAGRRTRRARGPPRPAPGVTSGSVRRPRRRVPRPVRSARARAPRTPCGKHAAVEGLGHVLRRGRRPTTARARRGRSRRPSGRPGRARPGGHWRSPRRPRPTRRAWR